MHLLRDIARRARQGILPTLGLALIAYFLYHTVEGERGLASYLSLQQEVRAAKAELKRTTTERAAAEARVSLLRADHLDPDLLEERARILLNYGHPDDLIILLPPAP